MIELVSIVKNGTDLANTKYYSKILKELQDVLNSYCVLEKASFENRVLSLAYKTKYFLPK